MTSHPTELKPRKDEGLDREAKAMEAQVQQRLRETDRFHTERLCQRYGDLVPAERIQRVKDLPTVFEDHGNFERSRLAAGARPDKGTSVIGFSQGTAEAAHVNIDDFQSEKTAIHERLHQLSDPRAAELLGRRLNEGVTEDLAIKELGRQPNPELPTCYAQERLGAQELRRMCGDGAVDNAYFRGDATDLRTCLDARLGHENLDRLKDAAEAPPPPDRDAQDSEQQEG